MNICLAMLAVGASMIYDGDSTGYPFLNVRLTGVGNAPFDTPEINQHAECLEEHAAGIAARELVIAQMPGEICILDWRGGGFGRPLGVLFGKDGRDVREKLLDAGLAREGETADWCGEELVE